MADVVKDTKTLFQDDKSLSKQYKEGYMGRAAGFDWSENTMMPAHTRGGSNGAYLINGASQTGATSWSIPAQPARRKVTSSPSLACTRASRNEGEHWCLAAVRDWLWCYHHVVPHLARNPHLWCCAERLRLAG